MHYYIQIIQPQFNQHFRTQCMEPNDVVKKEKKIRSWYQKVSKFSDLF
jgi:hypothetical protein